MRHSCHSWVHLALCALVPAACGKKPLPPAPPPPRTALAPVNDLRGEAVLTENQILTQTARAHAEEMARLGYFGHYSPTPGNRTPDDRLARHGWPPDRKYDELLAMADSLDDAVAMWAGKPKLKSALLNSEYEVAGVASATSQVGLDGTRTYWVLLLAEPG